MLELHRAGGEPLHRQLEHALRQAIRDGRLGGGIALPSSRALAAQLGVSRGVVVEAYEQLIAEGYMVSRPGGTTSVAPVAGGSVRPRVDLAPMACRHDFRPGRPEVGEFPRAAWLRSIRRVFGRAPADRLGYLDGHGVPELRLALAGYLNRARGTDADPSGVLVATGYAQALGLVARAIRRGGAHRVAVEDPSDPEYRTAIHDAGLESIGIPVDEDGIRVDQLARGNVDAVVVTAAHQYPTGAVMSPDRRTALVRWADRRGHWIVEDDYDAEFRYDRQPIGAIQGLSPDRVVYTGTASKVLAPGLRLGWIVAPPALVDEIASAKQRADMGSGAIDQLALADFIEHGELDHHLRHMRSVYRRRRDALLAALARHLPDLRPVGAAAGLHVLAWLPDDVDEAALVAAADADGIAVGALGPRRIAPGPGGLIFGYGVIDEHAIEPGIRQLARIRRQLG
jgi:GntR family transcriptional regulator / MocR family aminotransferase